MKNENKEQDRKLTPEELDKVAGGGGEIDRIHLTTIEMIEACPIFEQLKEIIRTYKVDAGYDINNFNEELKIANKVRDVAWRNGYSLRGPVLEKFLLMYWPLV